MGRIICIGSQKGGVGKTTTAINLAAALAIAEKKSLLVDMDLQGHSTTGMGISKAEVEKSIYHGLLGDVPFNKLITDTEIKSLKIIPACREPSQLYNDFISRPKEREKSLKKMLKSLKKDFSYILIDCPPTFDFLDANNALAAADSILIPLQCEFYALESFGQMLRSVNLIRQNLNLDIKIEGILLTMYAEDEKISKRIARDARANFNGLVFKSVIPRSKYLREYACSRKPVLLHDICSSASRCYLGLAKEIMARDG